MRHREAWAEEQRTPSVGRWRADSPAQPPTTAGSSDGGTARTPERRIVQAPAAKGRPDPASEDILIVASKLKAYVRARSGMNTSDGVLRELSDRVRSLCDAAIRRAREEGRKTLLDRDF